MDYSACCSPLKTIASFSNFLLGVLESRARSCTSDTFVADIFVRPELNEAIQVISSPLVKRAVVGLSISCTIIYSKIIELYSRLYNQSIYKTISKQDPILTSPDKLISSHYNPIPA